VCFPHVHVAGVYALIGTGGAHEQAFMHAALDEGGRMLLRDLVEQHERFYKYTGRV
jgi:hypothetical protein